MGSTNLRIITTAQTFTGYSFKKNLLYFSTTSSSSKNNITAPRGVVVYTNADTQKLDILKDNKEKSGHYRLINSSNGKVMWEVV